MTRLDVRIRAAEPEDQLALTAIFNQPSVAEGTLQLPYTSLAERRERFKPDATVRSLVAEADGQVVGMGGLHLESRRRAHVGWIGMGVDERYQGQGVGGMLVRALLDLADNWYNLRRVELTVFCDNLPAVHLYEKHGFAIEGRHTAFAYRNGDFADAYSMARLRNEPQIALQQDT